MKNFLIIFSAVILANLCTLIAYESYRAHQQAQQNRMNSYDVVEPAGEPEAVSIPTPADTQATDSERVRKASRMCDYWTAQLKEANGLNQALKEKACLRYNKLKKTTPSAE